MLLTFLALFLAAQPTPTERAPAAVPSPTTLPAPAPIPAPTLGPAVPSPQSAQVQGDSTLSGESVNLIPVYEAGDVMKLRWKQESVDIHDGEKIDETSKRQTNSVELDLTLKFQRVLPGHTYHCIMTVDRVMIDAPTFNGREHYDSSDPKTANGFFSSPAKILLSMPVEFGFAADSYGYARKEHPRLRAWNMDGTKFYDNTVGNDAFPMRFGPVFGWLIDSAKVGQSWTDEGQLRINNGATIHTKRTSTLSKDDGITMEIDIKGAGDSATTEGTKNLTFKNSTYEAKYIVNNASAKLRSGESTHTYAFDYMWKGKPATVRTTVKETLQRVD